MEGLDVCKKNVEDLFFFSLKLIYLAQTDTWNLSIIDTCLVWQTKEPDNVKMWLLGIVAFDLLFTFLPHWLLFLLAKRKKVA